MQTFSRRHKKSNSIKNQDLNYDNKTSNQKLTEYIIL